MSLCIIGSSHAVALHQHLADTDVARTSFISHGAGFKGLAPEGRAIVATNDLTRAHFLRSGNAERIDLAGFDRFVLIGDGPSIRDILRFYETHRLMRHDGQWTAPHLATEAVFDAALTDAVKASLTVRLARHIRGQSQARIAMGTPGLPIEAAMSQKPPEVTRAVVRWCSMVKAGIAGDLYAHAERIWRTVLGEIDVALILPPAETIVQGALCDDVYRKPGDFTHKNSDYGALMWRDIECAWASPSAV